MTGKRIFWRLFFSYIILLFIAICIIALIYQTSVESMQETLYRQSRSTLTSIRDTVDTLMKSVDNYAITILYDKDINAFLSIKEAKPNSAAISNIYRYTQTLVKYKLADSLIRNIYILSEANGFILFSNNAVRYSALYHESTLGFTGLDYTAMDSFLHMQGLKNGYYIFPGESGIAPGELVYVVEVPHSIASGGTILIRVNTQSILTLLQPACVGQNSMAFILDSDNQMLACCTGGDVDPSAEALLNEYCSGGFSAVYNNRYNITQVVSDMGWQYVSIVPRETVLSDVYEARRRIVLVTLLLVMIGIAISYVLTRKKARSLGNMVTVLTSEMGIGAGKRNEYVFIEDAVTRLVSDRSSFKTLSENQRMLIHCELVRRLLLEDYRNLDELKGLIAATGNVWDGYKYAVITVNIHNAGNNKNVCQDVAGLLYDCLSKQCKDLYYMLVIDETRIVLLFLSDPNCLTNEWHEQSQVLCEAINRHIQDSIQMTFCISEQYDRLVDIHRAYDETVVITEYAKALQQGRSILRLNDLPHSDEFYYYPMDVELKLVHHVKTGNASELEKLLHMIYVENFEKRVLSMAMIRQLVFELRGTIVRCLRSVASSEQLNIKMQELNRETTIEGIFRYVVKISMEICEMMKVNNHSEALKLKQVILDTIEQGYSDSNFSIHQLSENLHISENALYCFIRDHFEQTFWEMVENVRIHKACELMRNGSIPIGNIASRVGYNSDHSFRRAFKRIMNIAPSEFISSTH